MGAPKTARNAIIAESYANGVSLPALAKRWNLARSRVFVIIGTQGVKLSDAERSRRKGALSRSNGKKHAARVSESLRKRVEQGLPVGRPRLFADDPVKREEYLTISRKMGAAYAREAMGLVA